MSFAQREIVLTEDSSLETHIASDTMDRRVGKSIVPVASLPGPLTTPHAARSDCPLAWKDAKASSNCRSVDDVAARNLRASAVRIADRKDGKTALTEKRDSSIPTRKTAVQVGHFAKARQSGSTIDFERAYRLYRPRVYAKCLHMVGDAADAEDLTQEVFLQVFRKLDSFRGESAFSTWLYRVAVNTVLVRLRRKSLTTTSLEEVSGLKEGISSLRQFLGAPDRVLTAAIDRLNLERVFSTMPVGYRRVFLMHYVDGYEHSEIARILGLSVGTSKSQLYKARVWLRGLLRNGESERLPKEASNRSRHVPRRADGRSRPSRDSELAGSCI